ncbi:MAG: DUF4861 family protein, partial [Ferruginibacter sp.]
NNSGKFKKYTNVRLSLRSDSNVPSPDVNTAARSRGFSQNIASPFYQMEGPGIENDKVAFRAFFDYRNGKDIYGKIVDSTVLENVGVGASWHTLQSWGMDILKVGNSLGAGALAISENGQLFRLGDADSTYFKTLYEGAVRATFKLDFNNWDVGTVRQSGSEYISIMKGNYFYKNEVVLPLKPNQKLVAGMANFGLGNATYKKHNTVFSSISTYGKQAEGTTTNLGLAIMFSNDDYLNNYTSGDSATIPNTSYVVLKNGHKKTIYFFACWEQSDPRFKTKEGFEKYLNDAALLLANPIQVKIN